MEAVAFENKTGARSFIDRVDTFTSSDSNVLLWTLELLRNLGQRVLIQDTSAITCLRETRTLVTTMHVSEQYTPATEADIATLRATMKSIVRERNFIREFVDIVTFEDICTKNAMRLGMI